MDSVLTYIKENRQRFIDELIEFLKIPSVSAKSEHKLDCEKAAQFVRDQFTGLGLEAEIHPTAGNPVVLARYNAGADKPTVLVYGHYDVQPPEPLDLWKSPPFEPRVDNEIVYARGATDDKGQLFAHIKSLEAFLKTEGTAPVNLIYIIEGEEEVASDHVSIFLRENRDSLRSDVAVISDTCQFGPGQPALCYGLRGICATEIRVDAANQDLHSGSYGGAVHNAANALCEIVAKLKDEKGRIQIPGFYDDVVPLEDWEREAWSSLPFDEDAYRESLELAQLHGEEGYTTIERKWGRPTLDVNGIFGGYQGEGSKTVIPSWAGAKITMRLVPNQKPNKIGGLFEQYVKSITPPSVKVLFAPHSGCGPVVVPRESVFIDPAIEALKRGFDAEPVFMREGGSIPIVLTLKEELGLDTLLLGFGQPNDNAHAPNEKFSLTDFEKGIMTSAWFYHLCGSA